MPASWISGCGRPMKHCEQYGFISISSRRIIVFGVLLFINAMVLWQLVGREVAVNSMELMPDAVTDVVSESQDSVLIQVQVEQPVDEKLQDGRNEAREIHISATDAIRSGESLLREDNVPLLEGRFDLPFIDYLLMVEQSGGRLAVFDRQQNRVVGIIKQGMLDSIKNITRYSRRSRDVSDDLPVDLRKQYQRLANSQYGGGAYRFLVLLTPRMELRFVGTLAELLRSEGIDIEAVDRVLFHYRTLMGGLYLEIQEVERQGLITPVKIAARLWP